MLLWDYRTEICLFIITKRPHIRRWRIRDQADATTLECLDTCKKIAVRWDPLPLGCASTVKWENPGCETAPPPKVREATCFYFGCPRIVVFPNPSKPLSKSGQQFSGASVKSCHSDKNTSFLLDPGTCRSALLQSLGPLLVKDLYGNWCWW